MSLSRAVYRSLTTLGAPRVARRLRPGAPVFCFHNVVPQTDTGMGDASLHMSVRTFEAIAGWIGDSYEVVPVRELAERAVAGRSVRGLAAITFDDAYRGVFEHALPALAAASLPCTIFVVSGFADHPAYTWWDTLATRGLLTDRRRDQVLTRHRGIAVEVLAEADAALPSGALPDVFLPAPWDRIVQAAGNGVDLGSHTLRHANLAVLDGAELDEELGRSRCEIRERTGKDPDAVAYPYGLWNSEVLRSAARAGYRLGLTLGGQLFAEGQDLLGAPRINVPAGISTDALECWAAGIRLRRPW
jgi:peptidoglycan/xylan/chitin deacetylase (PgdA/CDA1 family)